MTAQERIAQAQAELRAFKVARDAKNAPKLEEAAAAQAEMELEDAKAIAAAEDEFGADNVRPVKTASGVVIVRRANPLTYKKFVDVGKYDAMNLEKLIVPVLVHPDPDKFDTYIAKEPHKLQNIAGAIGVLAGAGEDVFSGK